MIITPQQPVMAAADTGKDKDASTAAAASSWQETKIALLDSLLTCRLCTKRMDDDTRMLPCQHSFCTSCLLAHLSASSHLSSRSSTFTCPTCSVQTPRPASNNVDEFSRDERLCSLRIFLSQSEVSNGDDPGSNNRVKRTRVKRQRNGKSRDMNRNGASEISHQSRDVHITKSSTNINDGINKEEHCTANNESVTAGIDDTKVVVSRRPSLTDGGDNSRVVSRRGSLTNGTGTDSRVVSRRNSLTNGQNCFDFPNGFLQKEDDLNELANLLMGHKKGGFFDYNSQMPVCQNGCVLSPKHASIHAGGMLCGGCGSRLALPQAVDALQFELATRMAIRAHLRWRLTSYYNEEPTGVTFTPDGHVVVALHGDGVVCTYDGAGGRLRHIIDGVTPFAVATDVQRGLLLVGDRRESTIKTYDFTGKPVTHFEPDIFPWISGVAALPDNRYVVMDRNSCTVVVVTDEGEVTGEFGHIYDPQGDVTESFVMADYLCVDNSGSVLVSDAGNHCIKVFDDQGQMTSRISSRGHEDDRLEWPKGICVDDKGIIYIADHGNSRVSVFLRDGRFVCHVIARCKLPVGLAFHPPNTLALTQYSLDGRSQISAFSLEMIMTGVGEE